MVELPGLDELDLYANETITIDDIDGILTKYFAPDTANSQVIEGEEGKDEETDSGASSSSQTGSPRTTPLHNYVHDFTHVTLDSSTSFLNAPKLFGTLDTSTSAALILSTSELQCEEQDTGVASDGGSSHQGKLSRPCTSCRSSRVLCDRGLPCRRCVRLGRQCTEPGSVPRGRPSRARLAERARLAAAEKVRARPY